MDVEVVVVAADGSEREVALRARPGHAVRNLAEALADHLGTRVGDLFADEPDGSRLLPADLDVDAAGLRRGQVLRWVPRSAPAAAWEVVVHAGPDTGRVAGLASGTTVLGRSGQADIVVHDAFVSRSHLRLEVTASGVQVTDLGSANGTLVQGQPIATGHTCDDRLLELGSTLIEVRARPTRAAQPPQADRFGAIILTPPPAQPASPSATVVAQATASTVTIASESIRIAHLVEAARDRTAPLWTARAADGIRLVVGWAGAADGAAAPRALAVDVLRNGLVVDDGQGGDAQHAVAVAATLQAAILHGPEDIDILAVVSPGAARRWSWLPWLPHAEGPDRGLRTDAGAAIAVLLAVATGHLARPCVVVVDASLPGVSDAVAGLWTRPDVGVVVVGAGPEQWGGDLARLDLDPATGAILLRQSVGATASTTAGLGPVGMSEDVAMQVARDLAPLRRASRVVEVAVTRPDLADVAVATQPAALAAAWRARRPRVATIGLGTDGIVGVDLDAGGGPVEVIGPRAAVREVLTAAVCSLATAVAPDRITIVVADAVVAPRHLGALPHVVGVAGSKGFAALVDDVEVEFARREALLRSSAAPSWDEWRRTGEVVPAPLVVVVAGASADPSGRLGRVIERAVAASGLGVHVVVGDDVPNLGSTAATSVVVDDAGRATVTGPSGRRMATVPVAVAAVTADAAVSVTNLVGGRPSTTGGYTSLLRLPELRDTEAALVQACAQALVLAGLPRATWSPPSESFEHGRVQRTFVFTDIVGSTALVEVIGDQAWTDLVGWHDQVLRDEFATHGGEEVDHAGDGFLVAFEDASSAVACAVAIQRRLAEHRSTSGFAPRVRIGGHQTEVVRREGYKGHGLHLAARIGALAGGEQIVFSASTIDAVVPPPRAVNARVVTVKGATEPVEVLEVDWR